MTLILRQRTPLEMFRQLKRDLQKALARNPERAEDIAREAGSAVGTVLLVSSLILLAWVLGTLSIWWNWPI